MYVVAPEQRTLSTFAEIIGELKDRLHRWTKGASTASSSTTPKTRSLSPAFRHSTSAAGAMRPRSLEPLLFYVLHRASNEITAPSELGTFKTFLMDEAWLFFKNETIRSYIVAGAEDLAEAQRSHDPGHAVHQGAAVLGHA